MNSNLHPLSLWGLPPLVVLALSLCLATACSSNASSSDELPDVTDDRVQGGGRDLGNGPGSTPGSDTGGTEPGGSDTGGSDTGNGGSPDGGNTDTGSTDTDNGGGTGETDAGETGPGETDAGDTTTPPDPDDDCLGQGCACDASTSATVCAELPCVDGFCCNRACNGACEACDLEGDEGFCTPYDAGTDPEEECDAQDPSTCGRTGSCNGAGACELYGSDTSCNDGDACSYNDTCDGTGRCVGGGRVTCSDTACIARTCNGTPTCSETILEGASCDDGNLCSWGDRCSATGVCQPQGTLDCASQSTTCMRFYCDGSTKCMNAPQNIGGLCDDGDPETPWDTCSGSGICVGGFPPPVPTEACVNGSENRRGCGGARTISRIAAGAGWSISDDTCMARNDFDDRSRSSCWHTNSDHSYRIYMLAGESVTVRLKTTQGCPMASDPWSPWYATLQIFEPGGCAEKTGADVAYCKSQKTDQTTSYTASREGWVVIVADGSNSSGSEGDYTLTVNLSCQGGVCACE